MTHGRIFIGSILLTITFCALTTAEAQQRRSRPAPATTTAAPPTTTPAATPDNRPPKACNSALCTTPAYGVLLLRRAAVAGELAGLLVNFTEQYPQVAPRRFESAALAREMERLSAMPAANAAFLTETYGKILLRKIELETDIYALTLDNNEPPPAVFNSKKAELDMLNKELGKIFGN